MAKYCLPLTWTYIACVSSNVANTPCCYESHREHDLRLKPVEHSLESQPQVGPKIKLLGKTDDSQAATFDTTFEFFLI